MALALLEALDDEKRRVEEAVDAVGCCMRRSAEFFARERERARRRTEACLLAAAEACAGLALDAPAHFMSQPWPARAERESGTNKSQQRSVNW